jgi:hypothetical protein
VEVEEEVEVEVEEEVEVEVEEEVEVEVEEEVEVEVEVEVVCGGWCVWRKRNAIIMWQCADAGLSQFCTAGRGRAPGLLLRQLLASAPTLGKIEPISCVIFFDCSQ